MKNLVTAGVSLADNFPKSLMKSGKGSPSSIPVPAELVQKWEIARFIEEKEDERETVKLLIKNVVLYAIPSGSEEVDADRPCPTVPM
jgi:hypothetical protein